MNEHYKDKTQCHLRPSTPLSAHSEQSTSNLNQLLVSTQSKCGGG